MKSIYCVECGGVVPGLESTEFAEYSSVYNNCVQSVKEYREINGASLQDTPVSDLYQPAIEKYEDLTGFLAKEALHLYRKHKVSKYPLFCAECDLNYIAPTTKKCPECGKKNGSGE